MAQAGALQQLAHALSACGSVDGATRGAAEAQLLQWKDQPGAAALLASCVSAGSATGGAGAAEHVRQAAALLLRKVINERWSADGPRFAGPELSLEERAQVRAALPAGLADPSSKVRTAVALCLSAIFKVEDGWPELLQNLVAAVQTGRTSHTPLVQGAIRCLVLISDDIDEQYLPQLAQALLPQLCTVAADATASYELRAASVAILNDVLRSLGVISGVHQRQVRDLLAPLVDPWVPLLCAAIAQPLSAEVTQDWALRMASMRALTQLLTFYGRLLGQHLLPTLLQSAYLAFRNSLPLYQTHIVYSVAEGGQAGDESDLPAEVDEEGNRLDLEALLAQLFELLVALVGLSRTAKIMKPALGETAQLVVAYMQVPASQAAEWAANVATYVADEDEHSFTVRVSGELLIESLVEVFGVDAAAHLLTAVEALMQQATEARSSGQAGWWKLSEAALLAAGCVASSVEGIGGSAGGGASRAHAAAVALLRGRLQACVDAVLAQDLQQGAGSTPLLVGRALWLGARLQAAAFLRADQRPPMLAAAAEGLNSSALPVHVKIGACRVLAALAPAVPPAVLSPLVEPLYGGLLRLLGEVGEDALNLVLESMVPLIKADPDAAARALPLLSTPLLQVWSCHVADPLVSQGALAVLEALARVPQCLVPLASQAVPVLSGIVAHPQGQPDVLVEGCICLLATLVRPGRREVVAAIAGACFGEVLHFLPGGRFAGLDSASGTLTHAATELLVELVRSGHEDVLEQQATSSPAATALLTSTTALLRDHDEHRSCLAGDLADALLAYLPSCAAVQPVLGQLLADCARKLAAANVTLLVGGLLTALCRMVLVGGAGAWLETLSALRIGLRDQRVVSGLEVVLPALIDRHLEVRGPALRIVGLAVAALLASQHPALMSFVVRGRRLDMATGVRTRRQVAAAGGEQWEQVPVGVRLIAVAAELLVDQPWTATSDDDDDDDDDDAEEFYDEGESGEEDDDLRGSASGLQLCGSSVSHGQQASLDVQVNGSPHLPADYNVGMEPEQEEEEAEEDNRLRGALTGVLRGLNTDSATALLFQAAVNLLAASKQQAISRLLASDPA